jgi:hypothetical protein
MAFRYFVGAVLALSLSTAELHAQRVALVVADSLDAASDVRAHLTSAGITDVTVIDAGATTPTLPELLQYDAVFTWLNMGYTYADTNALGNALADYVDAGGGVVHAFFSFLNSPDRIGGRWDAESYAALSSGNFAMGFLHLVPVLTSHPILEGVTSFNGGNTGLHLTGVQAQGCAAVVARWSNGRPLVAARSGQRGGRVVALNLYPVSSNYDPQYWDAATDGGQLMANAVRFAADAPAYVPPTGPRVALVAADAIEFVNDVRCKLLDERLFSNIGVVDARSATPALGDLMDYDAVLTWPKDPYADPVALGDALADYVDQDRGVVQAVFGFSLQPGDQLGGRWQLGDYQSLTAGDVFTASGLTLVANVADHPILFEVDAFDGGTSGFHSVAIVPHPASTLVASWSDSEPLVVERPGLTAGRVVGLNFYPPSSDALAGLWVSTTAGARLMANALLHAAAPANSENHPPTADAGPDQTIEATSIAGATFTMNAAGSDPDGDPLTFTWSGAASGTGANVMIDLPLPPAPTKGKTYTVVLTVSDGKGGEAVDAVNLTVQDTTGPVFHGVPSVLTARAGQKGVAEVPYGPITATDAVDGDRPVRCGPAGPFKVGYTRIKCASRDTRENVSTVTFLVHVLPKGASKPRKPSVSGGHHPAKVKSSAKRK